MPDEVVLFVNGRRYEGWKTIRITRSIETIASSFDLGVSDKWKDQPFPWPIREEDVCRVELAGAPFVDGYVDRRSHALDPESLSLSYGGKDRTAALVECSCILDRWGFKNINLFDLAKKLCEPFRIKVTMQDGVVLPRPAPAKTVVNPGDTPFEVLQRVAGAAGCLITSDGGGGILICQAGLSKVDTSLAWGVNVKSARIDYDATTRFARYIVASQTPGSDTAHGAATRVKAEATDEMVQRTERTLLILPSGNLSAADARRRADWEARIRAARAETLSVTVAGWTQPSGAIWPVNQRIPVHVSPIGVDGEMLIAGIEHSAGSKAGPVTTFQLVRPDAFTPEPAIVKRVKTTRGWKELWNGGL